MLTTFLTVCAAIILLYCGVVSLAIIYSFSKLSPVEQYLAKITVSPFTVFLFLASLAWMVTLVLV